MKAFSSQTFVDTAAEKLCLYITGDHRKPGATICAEPVKPGTVYCPHHYDICVVEVKPPVVK